jgi:formylglycine-generating enzyme required for sulfatase activity
LIFGPLSATRYTINGVDVDMVRLPPGRFMDGQGPIRRRQILLSRPFELCVTAVTQALWRSVMGGPWAEAEDRPIEDNRPIEDICWNEVQDFLLRLERLGLTGFRLPTEAEWVWAARCGASTQWSGADRPKAVANASFSHSLLPWGGTLPRGAILPVARLEGSAAGVFDLSGGVWELSRHSFNVAPQSRSIDPIPGPGYSRAGRGGSWRSHPSVTTVRSVDSFGPEYSNHGIGFRLARSVDSGQTIG